MEILSKCELRPGQPHQVSFAQHGPTAVDAWHSCTDRIDRKAGTWFWDCQSVKLLLGARIGPGSHAHAQLDQSGVTNFAGLCCRLVLRLSTTSEPAVATF